MISVVIPVKNGAPWLDTLLSSLEKQTLSDRLEVICIDSGSDDESVSVIKKYPVRLIEIPPSKFNHGLTRNLGAREAKGDFVVMTVQDAKPADDQWLEKLLQGFVDDDVAGVCGQQIVPHEPDKNPVDWFNPQSKPELELYQFKDSYEFDKLSPERKKQICGWDDVNACYRREALMKLPFREMNFAEDAAWAMDALRAGYKIAYNKEARVFHYHHEPRDFAIRRNLIVYYNRYKLFGYVPQKPVLTVRRKLSMIKTLMKAPISFSQKWYWWKYNIDLHKNLVETQEMFQNAVSKGDNAVEELYERYCKEVPLASETVR
ncbi:MAG: glycosyltransferase [Chitinophagaceae bacterium]|nr:glycosyltransferase [Chitinophagaceae bacterium]